MHLVDLPHRFRDGYAIVGGHIPLAAGLAFATKYQKLDLVTVCFIGEGAVPSGQAHEAFNLAALWKLPVIFICENNRYGMGTPDSEPWRSTKTWPRLPVPMASQPNVWMGWMCWRFVDWRAPSWNRRGQARGHSSSKR